VKVKFGIRVPVTGPLASSSAILKVGRKAEELGFDAVTTHDHVTQPRSQRYHNSGGIAELVDENEHKGMPMSVFETMSTLSVLAGMTSRVRLIPSAAVLPWRHPVLFAKQAVTLHELSGGRFVCAVVVGRWKADFEAMNVDHALRGKIMDEYLEILSRIINDKDLSGFSGKFYRAPATSVSFHPKPTKKLPIWVGGSFRTKVFERIAKYAQGFTPGTMPAEQFEKGVPRLKKYVAEHGRDPEELEIGAQTFLCMSGDGEEARRMSHRTIESYFDAPQFDVRDLNDPSKTVREVLMEGVVKSALVGSPDDVIEKIQSYISTGVSFFDIRLVHKSVEEALLMMERFSADVAPSFN